MIRFSAMIAAGMLMLSGCNNADLAKKVSDLEARVVKLEANPGGAAAAAPNAEAEAEAAKLLREAVGDMDNGKYDDAKGKIAKIVDEFGSTRAARSAARVKMELDIIGKDAPTLATDKWFQGETSFADGDATLLVFWEVWCPHCRREVPKLQQTYEKFKGDGLNMIGLTKMTRDITEEQVNDFISENKISYPIAKEQGQSMSNAFGVRGVPAAAVVKDGKVVWRGHPAKINDDLVKTWL